MNIFEDEDDHGEFLRFLSVYFAHFDIKLYAWCLMSNHIHLLVRGSLASLSKAMKHILRSYAIFFNSKHGHAGHLFQGRFKSTPILDEAQLAATVRYIHSNPSKAGICSAEEYPWSSYAEYLGVCRHEIRFTESSFILDMFGGVERFVELSREEVDEQDMPCVLSQNQMRRSISEAAAKEIADIVLGFGNVASLSRKEKKERDLSIVKLKNAGLSVRQIERLTGIGRNIVQRAGNTEK